MCTIMNEFESQPSVPISRNEKVALWCVGIGLAATALVQSAEVVTETVDNFQNPDYSSINDIIAK